MTLTPSLGARETCIAPWAAPSSTTIFLSFAEGSQFLSPAYSERTGGVVVKDDSPRADIRRQMLEMEARLKAKSGTAAPYVATPEMEAERDAIIRDLREPQLRFILGD